METKTDRWAGTYGARASAEYARVATSAAAARRILERAEREDAQERRGGYDPDACDCGLSRPDRATAPDGGHASDCGVWGAE